VVRVGGPSGPETDKHIIPGEAHRQRSGNAAAGGGAAAAERRPHRNRRGVAT